MFDATASTDLDGTIVSYHWDFDDAVATDSGWLDTRKCEFISLDLWPDVSDALEEADRLMYQAKKSGKSSVVYEQFDTPREE